MPGIRNPLMINGLPVVAAPTEIDVTTAEQLRMVLLRAASRRQATVVVDMIRTRLSSYRSRGHLRIRRARAEARQTEPETSTRPAGGARAIRPPRSSGSG